MGEDNPKVSIITPVFNLEEYILDAITSVRHQTYANWEHLLIDDGSTDSSWTILESQARQDARIKPVKLDSNEGAARARNAGIELASGRFIAFLDGDDIWRPEKLSVQIQGMLERGIEFAYSSYSEVDESNSHITGFVASPERVTADAILLSNPVCCSTAVYDTSRLGKVYMPALRKRQDWGLWIALSKRGAVPTRVGEDLIRYRVRSGSVSSNKLSAVYYVWRIYRDILGLGLIESTRRLMLYVLLSVRKYRNKRARGVPLA